VLSVGAPEAVEVFGPGRFELALSDDPVAVATGDFDGDTAEDLVVVTRSRFVSDPFGRRRANVFLGDGSGSLDPLSVIGLQIAPTGIAVDRFDADGFVDLAVVGSGSVELLLGDGSGIFVHAETFDVGSSLSSIAVADFNRDGIRDVAVCDQADDQVIVLLGDGSGNFRLDGVVSVGKGPRSSAVGDFDGDGVDDLAVANQLDDSVSILITQPGGSLVRVDDVPVGSNPEAIVAGDLDGNGSLDLAVVNRLSHSVSVLFGNGTGAFPQRLSFDVSSGPRSIAVGDLDGNSTPDLAVGTSVGSVSILLGSGTGTFARIGDVQGGTGAGLALSDLDGDGSADIAVGDDSERSWSLVVTLSGGGLVSSDIVVASTPSSMVSADFDLNGVEDLAVVNSGSDTVQVLLGDGSGSFDPTAEILVGSFPTSIDVGNFDGDGYPDLAVAAGSNSTNVLLGVGDGQFTPLSGDTIISGKAIAVGDFDLNGIDDFAVAWGIESISVFLGDVGGAFEHAGDLSVRDTGVVSDPRSIAVGDFDGTGGPDLAVVNYGDGLGEFDRKPDVGVGFFPTSVVVGDFDGNGNQDLAVTNFASDSVSFLLGNGTGGFSPSEEVPSGDGPSSATVIDVDDDGVQDLVVTNELEDSASVFLGDGTGNFALAATIGTGQSPKSIVAMSLDQNKSQDLVVANSGSDTLSLHVNQLAMRADVNNSNRIDGFDLSQVGRLFALRPGDPGYRRSADVIPDGQIDGMDLSLLSMRFGELNRVASPLRPQLSLVNPPGANTVTIQQLATDGDLLTVGIVGNSGAPSAGAEFTLVWEPADLLKVVGFTQGAFFSGGLGQVLNGPHSRSGAVEATVVRLPTEDQVGGGPQSLLDLVFKGNKAGEAVLRFESSRLFQVDNCSLPEGCEVTDVEFQSGVQVSIANTGSGPPGQRLQLSPSVLDYGHISAGESSRRVLRVSNLGFSDLEIKTATSSLPEFRTALNSPTTIVPFSFVQIPIAFTPTSAGVFSADICIESGDQERSTACLPALGTSSSTIGVIPTRVNFGGVPVGAAKDLQVQIINHGSEEVTSIGVLSSDPRFSVHVGFETLGAQENGQIDVRFEPTDLSETRGVLTLRFASSTSESLFLSVSGHGE
jgi:hypothetical protein